MAGTGAEPPEQDEQPGQDERPGSDERTRGDARPGPVERTGPVAIARHVKDDGRALILYTCDTRART